MNLLLNNFENYREYFRGIATSSKHIEGFIHGDIEVGQREAGSWQGLKLWAWPATKSRMNNLPDNLMLDRQGIIWIGGPCGSDLHADQEAYYQNCEVVMKKVVSRMIEDLHEDRISVSFSGTMDRADMEISSTRFIGCEYTFTINDPDGFEYDENDWD